uniref:DUF998 domain-containing protein n=1 Tax=Ignisphaera aggregans TaxID=334771 RepID=A0A7C2Z994_9CREN
MARKILFIPLMSIAIPLICIAVSAILSPWFNVYDNALSDLGHATRSPVAPILNFGLSLGGTLIVITAVTILNRIHRILALLLSLTGYSLVLVAVFDEVYRSLHYWVSVLFFVGLAVSVATYAIITKNMTRIVLVTIALALSIILWIAHITYRVPRGAAIPELISILAAIPFYIDASLKSSRIALKQS